MGRGELQGCQAVQAPNWGAAAAERAVLLLGEHGMPAVYSRILEWHMEDAAAAAAAGMIVGCSGHLMAAVLEVDMAEKEVQSSGEHCMRRVLHGAERGAAVAAGGGCSGSS